MLEFFTLKLLPNILLEIFSWSNYWLPLTTIFSVDQTISPGNGRHFLYFYQTGSMPFMGWWPLFQKGCPFLARRHEYSATRDKGKPHLGVLSKQYNQPNSGPNNLKKPREYSGSELESKYSFCN